MPTAVVSNRAAVDSFSKAPSSSSGLFATIGAHDPLAFATRCSERVLRHDRVDIGPLAYLGVRMSADAFV